LLPAPPLREPQGEAMDKEFTTVSIPTTLYKKIEEFIKGTEYGSVSSYITKVLRESLSKGEPATEAFSKDEEEKVKERLKALGYID
jgi:Arc/MetJ-type ribon-helix-helix transcriptional regulator